VIGGLATATLRVVAEHADVWNMGGDLAEAVQRSALLDRLCAEIGRDPASITRSIVLHPAYDQPAETRTAIARAADGGFRHIVLSLPAPYPAHIAQWVTDELIAAL
jgi:alkanesulfonate monooxygenase SsuD/methylene tetrahydromethanopterin reductase-like flavin-dependent oxidoreductase (luciferase family)